MKKARKYLTRVHTKPDEPYWPCNLCYPVMLDLGRVPGGWLVYNRDTPKHDTEYGKDGKYAVLSGQGHSDDETLFFSEKPHYDREYGKMYEPRDTVLDFYKAGLIFEKYLLYNKVKQTDYSSLGTSVEGWLLNKVIGVIERWEKKFGTVEEFYKGFYARRFAAWEKKCEEQNKKWEAERAEANKPHTKEAQSMAKKVFANLKEGFDNLQKP